MYLQRLWRETGEPAPNPMLGVRGPTLERCDALRERPRDEGRFDSVSSSRARTVERDVGRPRRVLQSGRASQSNRRAGGPEETGIRVRIVGFLGMWLDEYANHYDMAKRTLNIYYHAEVTAKGVGDLDQTEITEARFFAPSQLPVDVAFPRSRPPGARGLAQSCGGRLRRNSSARSILRLVPRIRKRDCQSERRCSETTG